MESIGDRAAEVLELHDSSDWSGADALTRIQQTLERGGVLFLPGRGFELTPEERELVCDASVTLPTRKEKESRNGRPTVLFDPDRGQLLRSRAGQAQRARLEALMSRFAGWAEALTRELLPAYDSSLVRDRVTFRPCERALVQGLHMDASYGRPTEGRGMLRVFCNINPMQRARVWAVGESFEPVAKRVFPDAKIKRAGMLASMLSRFGITRGKRTDYDLLMEDIRGRVKKDREYQSEAPRRIMEFPAGSTWIALTDLVLHAAVSGQYSLDQTFFLPPDAMAEPERSSLRILERLSGRQLI